MPIWLRLGQMGAYAGMSSYCACGTRLISRAGPPLAREFRGLLIYQALQAISSPCHRPRSRLPAWVGVERATVRAVKPGQSTSFL